MQPEQAFVWTLRNAYERRNATRDNWAALLYGRDDITAAGSSPSVHTILKKFGIAVLRSDKKLAAVLLPAMAAPAVTF